MKDTALSFAVEDAMRKLWSVLDSEIMPNVRIVATSDRGGLWFFDDEHPNALLLVSADELRAASAPKETP